MKRGLGFGLMAAAWLAGACGEPPGVPEGKVAVVGEVALGPKDLAQVQHQLGTYAQRRFRGPEGQRNLLEALIDAELLAQEAVRAGLGDDPRVRWSVLEEIAVLFLNAELERRAPRDAVAQDTAALSAYYEAHRDDFRVPEKRTMKGVAFRDFSAAVPEFERARDGNVALDELGEVVLMPAMARDDSKFPVFHAYLFAPDLRPGDLLAQPVMSGAHVFVGQLEEIVPAHLESLDDEKVRARVIDAVHGQRIAAAREALLTQLRERFPEQAP